MSNNANKAYIIILTNNFYMEGIFMSSRIYSKS